MPCTGRPPHAAISCLRNTFTSTSAGARPEQKRALAPRTSQAAPPHRSGSSRVLAIARPLSQLAVLLRPAPARGAAGSSVRRGKPRPATPARCLTKTPKTRKTDSYRMFRCGHTAGSHATLTRARTCIQSSSPSSSRSRCGTQIRTGSFRVFCFRGTLYWQQTPGKEGPTTGTRGAQARRHGVRRAWRCASRPAGAIFGMCTHCDLIA